MERGARNGRRAIMVKETRVWLEGRQMSSIDVECLNLMSVRANSENGRVFVDTQSSQRIAGGVDGGDRVIHSKIPQPDLSVSATGN